MFFKILPTSQEDTWGWELQVNCKKTLTHLFFCDSSENFKDIVFTEHLRETASENGYSSK